MNSPRADERLLKSDDSRSQRSNDRQCPTCRGSGIVSKSPGLVALIPFDDHRLKRRHTFLWILLTIITCGLIGTAALAILLPRAVHLSTQNALVIDSTNESIRNVSFYQLIFPHKIQIKSENWIPIRLINLTTIVEHQLTRIRPDTNLFYDEKTFLRPMGTMQNNITIDLIFDSSSMAHRLCQGDFRQMLLLKIQTILTYADFWLSRIQTSHNVIYQYVLCNQGDWKTYERWLIERIHRNG